MMPAALIYAMSNDEQRTALKRAYAARNAVLDRQRSARRRRRGRRSSAE